MEERVDGSVGKTRDCSFGVAGCGRPQERCDGHNGRDCGERGDADDSSSRAEVMDGPSALGRDAAELAVWVHRVWVYDHFEQRQVVERALVGGGAVVEVEALAFGERSYCGRLCSSVEDLTHESSGPCPVFDLGDCAQRASQPQPPGDDLGQFDRCAGDEPDRVAEFQMSFGQSAGPVQIRPARRSS